MTSKQKKMVRYERFMPRTRDASIHVDFSPSPSPPRRSCRRPIAV